MSEQPSAKDTAAAQAAYAVYERRLDLMVSILERMVANEQRLWAMCDAQKQEIAQLRERIAELDPTINSEQK